MNDKDDELIAEINKLKKATSKGDILAGVSFSVSLGFKRRPDVINTPAEQILHEMRSEGKFPRLKSWLEHHHGYQI